MNAGDTIAESTFEAASSNYVYGGETDYTSNIVYFPIVVSSTQAALGTFNGNTNAFQKTAVTVPGLAKQLIILNDLLIVAGSFASIVFYSKIFSLSNTYSFSDQVHQMIKDNLQ